jgi:hypothetical protein
MNIQTLGSTQPSRLLRVFAIIALIFGVMTIVSGGSVVLGAANAWAGNYVGFVVWFNFLTGGVYVVAAMGLWMGKYWAVRLSAIIAITTGLVALGFAIVVALGSPFEMRTVVALALRISFWTATTLIAKYTIKLS